MRGDLKSLQAYWDAKLRDSGLVDIEKGKENNTGQANTVPTSYQIATFARKTEPRAFSYYDPADVPTIVEERLTARIEHKDTVRSLIHSGAGYWRTAMLTATLEGVGERELSQQLQCSRHMVRILLGSETPAWSHALRPVLR